MMRYKVRHSVAVGAAIAMLVGCGGGGGSSGGVGTIPNQPNPTAAPSSAPTSGPPTATPAPTPTPPSTLGQTIFTHFGSVAPGLSGKFSPSEGDTSAGGAGLPVDGVTCDPTMSNNYHVHFYLGVFVSGQLYDIPAGLGMENPVSPVDGIVNAATCFYHIHTHDESGIVHVEDPNLSNPPTPQTGTKFTLKTVFDIWGITVNSNQFGQFAGPLRVYTSGQVYRGDSNDGLVSASTLTPWVSDVNSIPIYSHELVFIEVGPTYPMSLPNVSFYTEF